MNHVEPMDHIKLSSADKDEMFSAFREKVTSVRARYSKLNKQMRPRVPYRLKWVVGYFNNIAVTIDKKFFNIGDLLVESTPIDKVARTFCLLEELDEWMDRVEAGIKKHHLEMEKQSLHKIVRWKTYTAFKPKSKSPSWG